MTQPSRRPRAGDAVLAAARAGVRRLPAPARSSVRRMLGRVDPWEPGAHLRPPACPRGMVTGAPDFVGVGVQKAGTTWWYDLLTSHPQVYHHPATHKERHFFMRFFDREFGEEDIAEYERWFPRPAGQQAGEWTPDYMLHFWVPRMLKAAAPRTKVLVLLRDPIDRIVSGLSHVATHQRIPDARAASEAYLRGRYFDQLRLLHSHFDSTQVLVQQYERCRLDPATELAKTFAFLGLPALAAAPFDSPVNRTTTPKVVLPTGVTADLVELYRDDVARLVAAYPEIDVGLWPNFA